MRNIFTLLFVMISALSNAQWSRLQLGIEGGYNISKFRSKTLGVITDKHGFSGSSAGISFQYKLNSLFSIKTGVFFYNRVTQGEAFVNLFINKEKVIQRNREFSFPILPLFHAKFNNKHASYIGIGPSLFFLFNYKITFNSNSQIVSNREINKVIFGLHGAIGYSYFISKRMSVNFEFRDILSVRRLDEYRVRLNSICFIVGLNYNIDFKNKAKE